MTPDRLSELRRQRALVQQHLEWLDREIAAAEPVVPPATLPPGPEIHVASPVGPMPDYVPDPEGARLATKRGCLLYAALALVLFFALLAAIYFWRYRDRPLLFAPATSWHEQSLAPGTGVV